MECIILLQLSLYPIQLRPLNHITQVVLLLRLANRWFGSKVLKPLVSSSNKKKRCKNDFLNTQVWLYQLMTISVLFYPCWRVVVTLCNTDLNAGSFFYPTLCLNAVIFVVVIYCSLLLTQAQNRSDLCYNSSVSVSLSLSLSLKSDEPVDRTAIDEFSESLVINQTSFWQKIGKR